MEDLYQMRPNRQLLPFPPAEEIEDICLLFAYAIALWKHLTKREVFLILYSKTLK